MGRVDRPPTTTFPPAFPECYQLRAIPLPEGIIVANVEAYFASYNPSTPNSPAKELWDFLSQTTEGANNDT
jgi:hypothetical protein